MWTRGDLHAVLLRLLVVLLLFLFPSLPLLALVAVERRHQLLFLLLPIPTAIRPHPTHPLQSVMARPDSGSPPCPPACRRADNNADANANADAESLASSGASRSRLRRPLTRVAIKSAVAPPRRLLLHPLQRQPVPLVLHVPAPGGGVHGLGPLPALAGRGEVGRGAEALQLGGCGSVMMKGTNERRRPGVTWH